MTGKLTTHVLDTARGRPGHGIAIDVYRITDSGAVLVCTARTNADGRCDEPLLAGDRFTTGVYQLVFHAAAYFRSAGVDLPDTPFLGDVVIRFGIDDPDQHYHVPLLLSPYGYSTYRGS